MVGKAIVRHGKITWKVGADNVSTFAGYAASATSPVWTMSFRQEKNIVPMKKARVKTDSSTKPPEEGRFIFGVLRDEDDSDAGEMAKLRGADTDKE